VLVRHVVCDLPEGPAAGTIRLIELPITEAGDGGTELVRQGGERVIQVLRFASVGFGSSWSRPMG
jgi:hypothetical protein